MVAARSQTVLLFASLLVGLAACTGDNGSPEISELGNDSGPPEDSDLGLVECDRDALVAELAAASAGDVVEIGGCQLKGPLLVRAGVSLIGDGPETSGVYGDGVLVTLAPGTEEQPTLISNLAVSSSGDAAIRAEGDGFVTIEAVELRAQTGIGIAIDGPDVVISDCHISGEVTGESLGEIWGPASTNVAPWNVTATNGVIALRSQVEISDSTIGGFFGAGFLGAECSLDLVSSRLSDNLGYGIRLYGCAASLKDVGVFDTHAGGLIPASVSGVLAEEGSALTSENLVIDRGDGNGLLEIGSSGQHVDAKIRNQGQGGYWIYQANGATAFGGVESEISDNTLLGIAILDSAGVKISDTHIANTKEGVWSGGDAPTPSGDGVHVVNSASGLLLQRIFVDGAAQEGIFFDHAGAEWNREVLDGVVIDNTESYAVWLQQWTVGANSGLNAVAQTSSGVPIDVSEPDTVGICYLIGGQACGGELFPTVSITTPNNIVTPNNLLGSGLSPFW